MAATNIVLTDVKFVNDLYAASLHFNSLLKHILGNMQNYEKYGFNVELVKYQSHLCILKMLTLNEYATREDFQNELSLYYIDLNSAVYSISKSDKFAKDKRIIFKEVDEEGVIHYDLPLHWVEYFANLKSVDETSEAMLYEVARELKKEARNQVNKEIKFWSNKLKELENLG